MRLSRLSLAILVSQPYNAAFAGAPMEHHINIEEYTMRNYNRKFKLAMARAGVVLAKTANA